MIQEPALLDRLQQDLGYFFKDSTLLLRALTHVSFGKGERHNEILEFLGDAVLDLAISDLLIRRHPEKSEGDLSKMRASLVNAAALARKAAELNLGKLLRLGKGEERSGGRTKRSILAGAYEALLGALYRDGGFGAVLRVVERHFAWELEGERLGLEDYKTRFQEISQMVFRVAPTYSLISETGPDHAKRFVTEIAVAGKVLARGEGKTKKQAEQEAAKKALQELQRER